MSSEVRKHRKSSVLKTGLNADIACSVQQSEARASKASRVPPISSAITEALMKSFDNGFLKGVKAGMEHSLILAQMHKSKATIIEALVKSVEEAKANENQSS